MKSTFVFLSLVALCRALVPNSSVLNERIIAHEDVTLGRIPFIVSLQTLKNFHFCGGSIIDENHVITTASCVQGKQASDIKVVAGTVDLDDPKAIYFGSDIVIHENYNETDSWINDIAIIKVSVPFELSETVAFASLPDPKEVLPYYSEGSIYGWGRVREGGENPKSLQRIGIENEIGWFCRHDYEKLGYNVYHNQMCTKCLRGFVNPTCHGDGGSPVVINGKVTGLVSWAKGCANTYPAVCTSVSAYIDWINEHKF